MENKLKGENYYTTDLWLRSGSNPPKNIKNKIKNISIRPVRINDQDKANERNYRPRFLKSNPYPYIPVFLDQQEAAQEDEPSTSATVEELMSLIDDNKVQASDFELLVDAAEDLSGPEKIMLNRRLFESASKGAQMMLQILNPEPKKEEPAESKIEPEPIKLEPEPEPELQKKNLLSKLAPYNSLGNDEFKYVDERGRAREEKAIFKKLSDEAMEMEMTPKTRNKRKSRRPLTPKPTANRVINPRTGRIINVGGKTYNILREEGVI